MISPHLNQLFGNVANSASPSILEQQVDLATTNNNSTKVKINKGNAKRGVSPYLTIWPCDLDLWPMTLKINRVPDSLTDYVCTKFGQNPLKDVDSRVFTRMLCGKHLTPWPLTLKINRVPDSHKD